jgi:predicted nucleic acid-binding protein
VSRKPVVVADTSPIVYLILIDQIALLPALFGTIHIPMQVFQELLHTNAPQKVRSWAPALPDWASVAPEFELIDPATLALDSGERSAIALAEAIGAHLILMDERKGIKVCLQKGFQATGTLGVLDLAARRGLVDLKDCFGKLKSTNFRYKSSIMDRILAQHCRHTPQ